MKIDLIRKVIKIMMISCMFLFMIHINQVEASYSSYDINGMDAGRYPGYKELLQKTQAQHPNWKIKLFYTGLDWNYAVENERTGHGGSPKSLIQDTYDHSWFCTEDICKDRGYDVSGRWRCASKQAIEYMMDPRNSLTADYIFQFQDLGSSEGTRGEIEKMVEGTFISSPSCVSAIMEAAQTYQISPFHLVSRITQEQGTAGIGTMNGYVYTTESGERVVVYNLFNISVSGNDSEAGYLAGAKVAYENGWFTREASIKGGAKFLREKYIDKGQSTLYFQKYNVVDNQNLFAHQYMQNIRAANDEGNRIYQAYNRTGVLNSHFEFTIPIYENMPYNACPRPYKIEVSDIKFEKDIYVVYEDEAVDIPYTIIPSNASSDNLYWSSSNEEVIRVFGNRFRGLKDGTADVIVRTTDGRFEKRIKIFVRSRNKNYVKEIKTNQDLYIINVDEAIDIPYTYTPENSANAEFYWDTSNAEIMRVFGNRVRGLKEGTAEMIVNTLDKTVEKRIKIIVRDPNKTYVQDIQLQKQEYSLDINEAIDIPYDYTPKNAVNAEFYWDTSNSDVIRVFGNRVRGLKEGKAEIIIKTVDGSFEKRIPVTVKDYSKIQLEDIKLEKEAYTINLDEAVDVAFSYTPEDVRNVEVEWISSNPEILRVYGNRFRGLKEGTAEVIVRTLDGRIEKRIKVTVNDPNKVYVQDVKLPKEEYTLDVDEAIDIPYDYTPTNAINAEFYWDTTNPEIIRVFGNRVRGLKEGKAEIIITTLDKTFEKRVKVTVKKRESTVKYVESMQLDKEQYTVYEEEAIDIGYKYAPTNAVNAEFYWDTTNPEIIRVFGNRLRGLKAGTTELVITTLDGKFEKRVKVTVKKREPIVQYVKDIQLDQEEYTVYEGEAIDINYTVNPTNAVNAEFYWDTTNPEIIRVFGNRLRGLKAGTTELVITTLDGKFEKRVKVTVLAR